MVQHVIMPKAGMAMETGTVIQWLKNEGDTVAIGDPLLEIETDKVSMEVEAEFAGVLLKILKGPGEVVPVTETIGYIGEAGEAVPDAVAAAPTTAPNVDTAAPTVTPLAQPTVAQQSGADKNGRTPATPAARRLAAEHGVSLRDALGSGPRGEVRQADVLALVEGSSAAEVKASSLARRIAGEKGISLAAVHGTGPQGRVTRDDVLAAASAVPGAGDRPVDPGATQRRPITGMRKVIAENMMKSHLGIPSVTLNAIADVSRLLELRAELNAGIGKFGDAKISINDLVIKAVGVSLTAHQDLNVTVEGDEIVQHRDINIGMAVALPDGLIVPVIRNVDEISVSAVSRRTRDLAGRARDRKLQPAELEGGTFTISNLGMYGIVSFNPIINPPQAAILGVCAITEVPYLENGALQTRKQMGLSLTIDHRVIDGAQGAVFLQTLSSLLEQPAVILK